MKSNFLNLNWKDLAKAFLVAFLTALIAALAGTLEHGGLPTIADLKLAGWTSLVAAISYLVKNFLTNSDDKMLKKEDAQQ